MAASSGRMRRPGGVVRAGLRLALLVGFGFVSGLLIGVLTEEPELLAGHMRGESEAIVLTTSVEPAAEVAALDTAPPLPSPSADVRGDVVESSESAEPQRVAAEQAERQIAMQPRAEERGGASLPGVSAALEGDGLQDWSIQVGAFADEKAAERLAESLRGKGYPVRVLAGSGGTPRWRVRVQPVRGEQRATAMSQRLKRDEGLPTWPQPMEARSAR